MPDGFAVSPPQLTDLGRRLGTTTDRLAAARGLSAALTSALGSPRVAAAFEHFARRCGSRAAGIREDVVALAGLLQQAAQVYASTEEEIARAAAPIGAEPSSARGVRSPS
ncbi:MAG: hypothetical protein K6T28_05960 [Acidothermus sp.]|nr:hypothetical protein [Acidothermus sp.]